MEISMDNAQTFTGFKLTNKTKQGAAKLIEDISSKFVDKEGRADQYKQFQANITQALQERVINPLKEIKAEVEYNDGRIFVRSADGSKSVEIDRGKVAPLHPQEYTVVQYPIKGDKSCVKVDYGTRGAAEEMAKDFILGGPFGDLLKAKEIAKHFDSIDAKKVLADNAISAYQKNLDTLAGGLLDSLE